MAENNTSAKNDINNSGDANNNNKKKSLSLGARIGITIAVVILLIGIAWLIYYLVDYLKGQADYDKINQDYANINAGKWYDMCDVNIAELKLKNQDTRGWLFFENEEISYPIVQGADDEKYLNTSFNGDTLRAGSIFLEALNKGDFSDKNNIIYGHNMRDQSMFGRLQQYKYEEGYYKDHLYFQVITGDKKYRFKVFSYNDVSDTSDVYTISFASDRTFVDFIKQLKQISQVNIDVPDVSDPDATEDEKIIQNYKKLATLSTCTSRDDMRFVVVGTLVGEYDNVNKRVIYDSEDI